MIVGGFTAWDWQEREIRDHWFDPKRAFFASPRLGKTIAAVGSIEKTNFERILVTGPLVCMPQWSSMFTAAGYNAVHDLYKCTVAQGTALLRALPKTGRHVIVVNDDKLAKLVEPILKWGPQAVIGDESHRWRGVSTVRARAARRICWHAQWVRILTGTPAPSHYGNLWGQMVALDKDAWGSSYEKFANEFLVRDAMFPSRVLMHKNVEELQMRLLRYATIVRREDVFGPDQYEYVTNPVELPDAARKLYNRLAKEWLLDAPFNLTTDNILVRIMRLRQIASGHLPLEGGAIQTIHNERIKQVVGDLEDIVASSEKSVIFHRFTWEGKQLEELIKLQFGAKFPIFTINGSNSARGTQTAAAFNTTPGSAVCIVQTQSGGVSISLCESQNAQFVSQDFNFDEEYQALSRVYKPGCRRTITYYPVAGTVDDYIAEMLDGKQNVHEAVRNADRRAMAFGNVRSRRSARIGKAAA